MDQDRPHPTYVRVQDSLPYGVDDWPRRVGFLYLPATRCWHRLGGWTLTRIAVKYWLLSHPDFRQPRRVTSLCRVPEAVALDLAAQVREVVEPA